MILSEDEFSQAIKKATGKDIEPWLDIDSNEVWFHYDKSKYQINNVDNYVKESLSKYFEINVTNIHMDNDDEINVYIIFDKDLSPEKNINMQEIFEMSAEHNEEDVDNSLEL